MKKFKEILRLIVLCILPSSLVYEDEDTYNYTEGDNL